MDFDITAPKRTIHAPTPLRGKPSTDLLTDLEKGKSVGTYKVRVNKNHEPWNVYKIIRTGQEVKIKLTVDEVYGLEDAYDQGGSPIYHVPSGAAVLVKESAPNQGS